MPGLLHYATNVKQTDDEQNPNHPIAWMLTISRGMVRIESYSWAIEEGEEDQLREGERQEKGNMDRKKG